MKLSSANLEIIRKRPQQTKLYLSIFEPQTIFKALVNNASADFEDRVIPYDNVTLGSYGIIRSGQTMLIGTTAGGSDLGKVRVRSATATDITVSENSNVDWQDNAHITILQYWELWPIYPRIIIDPSNDENVIFYKDYDVAYSNQNSILGTFVTAGPHRAAWLDPASGQTQLFWSSTGTYSLLGNTLSHSWFFEGATVTGSTAAEPGWITYNQPGHFVTTHYVSGTSGETDITYRYVSIYNEANPPINKWQLDDFSGSRDEGGYSVSIRVFETIPITEHAVVVIFSDDYYGDSHVSLGGNYPNSSSILFSGYVDKDSIVYDWEHSEVSFDALSLTGTMKKTSGFSISVESEQSPAKWYQLLDMDSPRAIYHYLRWHTTALFLADFAFVGELYKIQFFDSDRESMYDAIDNYMRNTLIGQTVSDRQGKVWMETQAMAYSNPTGTFLPVSMSITNRDWMESPTIDERLVNDISYMEYGGIAFSGVNTGTFTPLMGSAPGTAPGFYGGIQNHQGLALAGQNQLNTMLGNMFANMNSPFSLISMDMTGKYSNLDIAPQETVQLTILPQDTVRNLAVQGLFIPDTISWTSTPDELLLPRIDFKQLVNGVPGKTVTIPNIEDIGEGFNVPSLNLPPLPDVFSNVPNEATDDAPPKVIVHDPTYGLIFTQTFNTERPQWYTVNAGLTTAQYQGINKIVICPSGAIYVGRVGGGFAATDSFLARADYVGGTFVILEDATSMSAKYGGGNVWCSTVGCDKTQPERVVYILNDTSNSKPYIGSGNTFTEGFNVAAGNQTGDVSFGDGAWIYTTAPLGAERLFVFNDDISAVTKTITPTTTPGLLQGEGRHVRAGSSDVVFMYQNNINTTISKFLGNGTTKVDNIGTDYVVSTFPDGDVYFALDNGGQFLMSNKSGSGRGKSSDGGYTLIDIANLPFVAGNWKHTNCGTSDRWISVYSYVYYTSDNYSTAPIDKRGDILTINPIILLDNVRVVP